MRDSEGIAAFRVDAMVHRSYERIGEDAVRSGIEMPDFARLHGGKARVKALSDRLADHNVRYLRQLVKPTVEKAPERVAPWAKILLNVQRAKGRDIALYSPFLPEEIVEAYAEGLENEILGLRVQFVHGVKIVSKNGYFTHAIESDQKLSYVQRLIKTGHHITFLAAGSAREVEDLEQADHPLIVNGYRPIEVGGGSHCPARIRWDMPDPNMLKFAEPMQVGYTDYNLGKQADRSNFTASVEATL